MNCKTLMSIQLSYSGLDPFLRIGSSALALVGVLHRGKRPVVVFRRERNLDLFAILVNPLLKDWQGRIKFVDDTTLDVHPVYCPSL